MRHHRGARDDRLHRAQVLAERPGSLAGVHEPAAGGAAALDLAPEHAAVEAPGVLPRGQLGLRERREARVDDARDLGVRLEEGRDLERVRGLRAAADAHRLRRLEREEGLCGNRVDGVGRPKFDKFPHSI